MPQLKKHNDVRAAVVIDGSSYISLDEGILHEYVEDGEVYLYIKNADGTKEAKIKIIKR
jgi:hypothetical protein